MSGRRFDDKTVLVTGAASGIGRATALRLVHEGARLVVADRDSSGLDDTVRACGAHCSPIVYDAADAEASASMARQAAAIFGGLDSVVCNAGIYRRGHFTEISPDDWSTLFAVNLTSVVRIIQSALPSLKASRGNVVSVASTAGIGGIAYAAHYAASKAGIIALMKSLAVEYAPDGVRFNAVAPGRVKTAIASGLAPLSEQDPSLLVRPPKLAGALDGGEPSDIAGAIAFLASNDARYITGSTLVADGAQNIG